MAWLNGVTFCDPPTNDDTIPLIRKNICSRPEKMVVLHRKLVLRTCRRRGRRLANRCW
jgi:hypothetical protein